MCIVAGMNSTATHHTALQHSCSANVYIPPPSLCPSHTNRCERSGTTGLGIEASLFHPVCSPTTPSTLPPHDLSTPSSSPDPSDEPFTAIENHCCCRSSQVTSNINAPPPAPAPARQTTRLRDMPSYRHVVRREANNVISAMRQNSRWAPSSTQNVDPMLMSFIVLKEELSKPGELPIDMLVNPFLDVIRSDTTTGAITSVALHCVHNFILQGLIQPDSANASRGVNAISQAVTHTRFVETDRQSDEVVLLRIIQVLEDLLFSSGGALLSNDSVGEMLQACFRISFESHLSDVLRHYARVSFGRMIHHLFSRLDQMILGNDAPSSANPLNRTDIPLLNESSSVLSLNLTESPEADSAPNNNTSSNTGNTNNSKADGEAHTNSRGVRFHVVDDSAAEPPYNIVTLCELLRFISGLIDPLDGRNTEKHVATGLSMVIVVFETAVRSIHNYPALFEVVENTLCFNLFEALSHKSFDVFSAALHALYLLMETQRATLKFQLEKLILKLIHLDPATYEHEEAVIEYLLQFVRQPSFVVDLYQNFDCNPFCDDLVEKLIQFLIDNVQTEVLYTTSFLALEALIILLEQMVNEPSGAASSSKTSASDGIVASSSVLPSTTSLALVSPANANDSFARAHSSGLSYSNVLQMRKRKAVLRECITAFNEKPKAGISKLVECGMIPNADAVDEIATLVTSSTQFDKSKVGEYIGKDTNTHVLAAYVRTFDFGSQSIDASLRSMLTSFRLPGESQVIERILTSFSEWWMESTDSSDCFIRSVDAATVLSYAIVMLNVDQHSPKVQKRMTVDQFVRNLRGANEGENFDRGELERIYYNIRNHEIIIPDEHTSMASSQVALWETLVSRSRQPSARMVSVSNATSSNGLYHAIFVLLGSSFSTALAHILSLSDDKKILSKVETGYIFLSDACGKFRQSRILDTLFDSISSQSIIIDYEGQQLTTAALESLLTRKRAQLCLRLVFDLCRRHGDLSIRGWAVALSLVHTLISNRILPNSLSSVVDFVREGGRFHYFTPRSHERAASKTDTSVFSLSSFSSFFSSSPQSAQSSALEGLRTSVREVIDQCNLDRLFHESTVALSEEQLYRVVVLVAHYARGPAMVTTPVPSRHQTSPVLASNHPLDASKPLAGDNCEPSNGRALSLSGDARQPSSNADHVLSDGRKEASSSSLSRPLNLNELLGDLPYTEDCAVFFLELLTDVSILNNRRVDAFWGELTVHFFKLLSIERGNHYLMERVVVCLLRITQHFLPNPVLQPQVLDLLRSLADVPLQSNSLAQVGCGLCDVIQARHMNLDECEGWEAIGYLLRACVADPSSAFHALKAASYIAPCLTQANAPHLAQVLLRFTHIQSILVLLPSTNGPPSGRAAPLGVSLLELAEGVFHRALVVFAGTDRSVDIDFLWAKVWEPLLQTMTHTAICGHAAIRSAARECLNHALFDPITDSLAARHWGLCFKNILVPFMFKLIDATSRSTEVDAMFDLRDAYCSLLSRVFRRRLQSLHTLQDFPQIWINTLTIFNSLYALNHVDSVRESLKIAILLMTREGVFEKSDGPFLWEQTWRRVHAFLPGFYQTIFNESMPAPIVANQTQKERKQQQQQQQQQQIEDATEARAVAELASTFSHAPAHPQGMSNEQASIDDVKIRTPHFRPSSKSSSPIVVLPASDEASIPPMALTGQVPEALRTRPNVTGVPQFTSPLEGLPSFQLASVPLRQKPAVTKVETMPQAQHHGLTHASQPDASTPRAHAVASQPSTPTLTSSTSLPNDATMATTASAIRPDGQQGQLDPAHGGHQEV